jgi:hypothetical protein
MKTKKKPAAEVKPTKPSRPPLDQPNRLTIERLFKELIQSRSRAGRIYSDGEYRARNKADTLAKKILSRHPEYQRLRRISDRLSTMYANHESPLTAEAKSLRQRYMANGITPEIVAALNKLLDRSDDGTAAAKKLVASLGI